MCFRTHGGGEQVSVCQWEGEEEGEGEEGGESKVFRFGPMARLKLLPFGGTFARKR